MNDDLLSVLQLHEERAAVLLAAFEAAEPRVRARVTLAEYRCRRRCSLLVVWQAAGVRLVRLPPYKLSKVRNAAETVESARAKRTTDGNRHWQARVIVLDELASWPGSAFDLKCDHVSDIVRVPDLLADVERATPGAPTRRVIPR